MYLLNAITTIQEKKGMAKTLFNVLLDFYSVTAFQRVLLPLTLYRNRHRHGQTESIKFLVMFCLRGQAKCYFPFFGTHYYTPYPKTNKNS